MVTSVISGLGSLLSSASSDAKLVGEELSENSAAAETNVRLPEDDINEARVKKINKVIVSPAVEHDKESATEIFEDIEKATNDAETGDSEDIVIVDDTSDVLVHGIFFEIFGCLPIFFVIYWPLFLFLITKICKVAQIAKISPRVAQPM